MVRTKENSDRQQNSQSASATNSHPSFRFALLTRADILRIRQCHLNSLSFLILLLPLFWQLRNVNRFQSAPDINRRAARLLSSRARLPSSLFLSATDQPEAPLARAGSHVRGP